MKGESITINFNYHIASTHTQQRTYSHIAISAYVLCCTAFDALLQPEINHQNSHWTIELEKANKQCALRLVI